MEMSWIALAPTIFIAVIIGAMALVKPGTSAPVAPGENTGKAKSSASALPVFSVWFRDTTALLRDARQPVWPIDYSDLRARANRGILLGGAMSFLALFITAENSGNNDFLLIGMIFGFPFYAAFGGVMSVAHTLVLRVLPYRGAVASIALGALIGLAASFFLSRPAQLNSPLVKAGALYGLIIGMMNFLNPPKKTTKASARAARSSSVRSD